MLQLFFVCVVIISSASLSQEGWFSFKEKNVKIYWNERKRK
jgi:hypothetical protein